MHLHIIFTVNSSQMNNEAAILKIRICLFFWFAVYYEIKNLLFMVFLKWLTFFFKSQGRKNEILQASTTTKTLENVFF